MRKTNTFDNKLKLYSALALGVLGTAGAVNGQVVYYDLVPDVTLKGNADSLNVDIDANGVADFQFQTRVYGTSPNFNYQANLMTYSDTNNLCMLTLQAYTSLGYAVALASGDSISGTSPNWHQKAYQAVLASVYNGTNYGHFGDGLVHYCGIKFMDGTNLHYGWIRVGNVPAHGDSVTIMDWAYQTGVGIGITAGEGAPAGIQHDDGLLSSVFAFNKKIHIRFKASTEGTISIYNSLGEMVVSKQFSGTREDIDLSDKAIGIYIIKVQTSTGNIVKKVSIQ